MHDLMAGRKNKEDIYHMIARNTAAVCVKKVTANDKENMKKKKKGLKARVVSYDVFAP